MIKNLRGYQQEVICKVEDALKSGVSRQLVCMATGLGKTFTAVKIVEKLQFKRILWITHNEELIQQSGLAFLKDKFDDTFAKHVQDIGFLDWVDKHNCNFGNHTGTFKMGAIKSSVFKINAEVTMASAQTLYRRLDKIPFDYFDCIVVDECHLFMAKTFLQPLEYFKPKLLLGLTATPHRMDGLSLGNIFEQITYEYNIGQGIKDGYLCELDGIRVQTNVSLDNVRTTAGELNQKDLADEVNIPRRNQLIIDKYKEYADGRQGIFFCVDIQHACDLADMFIENGISCKPIVGDEEFTPDRVGAIQDFKDRKIQVLTNCQILTTGFDEPNVGVIGNASPTKSLTKYMQSCGRGSRLKNKEYVDKYGQNCIILDFVDSSSRHKLINTWTLDQGKNLEDRVFLTQDKRDYILEERARKSAKVENLTDKDERIKLIELPPAKQFGWKKMQEAATSAQLKYISDLGHDIQNNTYTKQQCADIISLEPCNKKELEYLKSKGYDTTFATKGQYGTIYYELEMKNKWKKK
jgi:superfamily II DNA or RNA helicase